MADVLEYESIGGTNLLIRLNGLSVTVSKELIADLHFINKINGVEVITEALKSVTKQSEVDEAVCKHLEEACKREKGKENGIG